MSVAAILRPTMPDFPTPETITRPRAWRMASTAPTGLEYESQPMDGLEGTVAVVTGAAGGIGGTTARLA